MIAHYIEPQEMNGRPAVPAGPTAQRPVGLGRGRSPAAQLCSQVNMQRYIGVGTSAERTSCQCSPGHSDQTIGPTHIHNIPSPSGQLLRNAIVIIRTPIVAVCNPILGRSHLANPHGPGPTWSIAVLLRSNRAEQVSGAIGNRTPACVTIWQTRTMVVRYPAWNGI